MSTPRLSEHFIVQGHRGARAHLPENSIPGFILAIEQGADVIELDLVVSRDTQLVVNHEPWLKSQICLTPNGDRVQKDKEWKLFEMDMVDIRLCDCGSLGNPAFPTQEKMSVARPALWEVVQVTEQLRTKRDSAEVMYNMEIKYRAEGAEKYHPRAEQFVSLVLGELRMLNILDRSTIQSFSSEVLEELHRQAPDVKTVWLTEDNAEIEEQLSRLTFIPSIYSPSYKTLTPEKLAFAHEKGMLVIPWTINDPYEMLRMIEMGVDGIISDFPDILKEVERNAEMNRTSP